MPEKQEKQEPRTAKPAAKEAPERLSPEGVPYQTSGMPEVDDDDNPGPFEDGEGRNSDRLAANQPDDD